ncbi:Uncharacterised protein [Mycobacteroides abscessus subsp. abscessus]|nr:Uncharacterised protein [Mycobacteroides abscessus subsp. abscessus]
MGQQLVDAGGDDLFAAGKGLVAEIVERDVCGFLVGDGLFVLGHALDVVLGDLARGQDVLDFGWRAGWLRGVFVPAADCLLRDRERVGVSVESFDGGAEGGVSEFAAESEHAHVDGAHRWLPSLRVNR